MLIGTAGHIDHGKTTLIRALTGVDTDRLPEEKRRGISIDLGFAYLPVADGSMLAFIDVPGHEKFVPTMLAGAAGIDFALLVVAADDGPMPQTREHLDILRLLGLKRGAVALTKIDRATPGQRAAAEAALVALLADSPFADAPWFPVAATSGAGIAELRAALEKAAANEAACAGEPLCRLAIDRSFSLSGAGTVVTGTLLAGRVAVGDTLHLLSLAKNGESRRFGVRVRGLHANHRPAESATRGVRCAINLAGLGEALSHHDIGRGDWLVGEGVGDAGARFDVALDVLPGSEKYLRPGVELHVHHGARHLMGKLVPLDPARQWFQLVFATPQHACHGDRLILRDASGRVTLAAARVLDPDGPQRQRTRPERLAQLAALDRATADERLAGLLAQAPEGVDLRRFAAHQNAAVTPPAAALTVAGWAFAAHHAESLATRVGERLAQYHASHPDELGLERDRLRRFAAPRLDGKLFLAWLEHWKAAGRLARSGNAWHLPSHRVELSGHERTLAEALLPRLSDGLFEPPWVRDLATALAADETAVRQTLRKLAAQGEVFQVVKDLFYPRATVAALVTLVRRLAGPESAPVKAAALRDASGLGRKRAIQILEFFDRVGFTRRIGSGQLQAHALRGEPPVA